jgi:Flp pilus assembly protein TadG
VITGWLVKIVVVIALLGFAALELGSPLWTRAQLDGVAHDAADEAARAFANGRTTEQARQVAEQQAESEDALLTEFSRDAQGKVHVTVFKEARSYLLHRFGPTKDWYDVSVDASSTPPNT